MRSFACPNCRALLFFENSVCVTCAAHLGFVREPTRFVVVPVDGRPVPVGSSLMGRCANAALVGCNWLAPEGNPGGLCDACALTRTRPADTDPVGLAALARTEAAKKRLVFQLDRLHLPTTSRRVDRAGGLAFDLLSSAREHVITGHDDGIITIDLAEGDDSHRERMRTQLAEPYRTLLGHLRHEIGHWYWNLLVDGTPWVGDFRELFGDERRNYGEALAEHYGRLDDGAWRPRCVSRYAASHPWEDWAETFAHYLHMRDTLETAADWHLTVGGPALALNIAPDAPISASPQLQIIDFDELVATWMPLTFALNAVNRSMGHADLYPFLLPAAVVDKLRFVHARVTDR